MTHEPTDGPMQLASPIQTQFTAVTRPSPPLTDANPRLDQVVDQQARYRITGSGPLSQRTIVPLTAGAHELAREGAPSEQAVRGVLALIEHVAGGPSASAGLQLNGIALSDSALGHGANTYRSHLDDDHIFKQGIASRRGADRAQVVQQLGNETVAQMGPTRANVTAGWVNVGPTASAGLLGMPLSPAGGPSQPQLAEAIRTLLHEAAHVADQSTPNLSTSGAVAVREALAEARSTKLGQLQQARRVLGLDASVNDGALQGALSIRPYAKLESLMSQTLKVAGLNPAGSAAQALLARPGAEVVETLVSSLARADSQSEQTARTVLDETFAKVLQAG